MTLPLTKDVLRAAYAYLADTPPFNRWNLPDADDIVFRVTRSGNVCGTYEKVDGKHVIGASSVLIGRTASLMALMAHEMVHLHQNHSGMESPHAEHNAAFHKLAERVCDVHGFDPKLF